MSGVLLEVCVDDAAGLEEAIAGGADRIELCSALATGGLTPSAGLMALAAGQDTPVYAMIRARGGDFVFGEKDIDIMMRDIDTVRTLGLAGVVLGASLPDGSLDSGTLERLVRHAGGLGTTLHRAFDLVPDFRDAVDIAAGLGFERILTSGGATRAADAIEPLAEIIDIASGRLSIMPGSGITHATVTELVSRLPVSEVHASCSLAYGNPDRRVIELGFVAADTKRTSREAVRALKDRLTSVR